MPALYIITGSNGAGKSSIGPDYLPKHIQLNNPVFDGDKLFMEKQGELWRSGVRAQKDNGMTNKSNMPFHHKKIAWALGYLVRTCFVSFSLMGLVFK